MRTRLISQTLAGIIFSLGFAATAAATTTSASLGSMFVGRDNLESWSGIYMRPEVSAEVLAHVPTDPVDSTGHFNTTFPIIITAGTAHPGVVYSDSTYAIVPPGDGWKGGPKDGANIGVGMTYKVGTATTPDKITFNFDAHASATNLKLIGFDDNEYPGDAMVQARFEIGMRFDNYPSTAALGAVLLDPLPSVTAGIVTDPVNDIRSLRLTVTVLDSDRVLQPGLGGFWDRDDPLNSTSNPASPILVPLLRGYRYRFCLDYSMRVRFGTDPDQSLTYSAFAGVPIPESSTAALATLAFVGMALRRRR